MHDNQDCHRFKEIQACRTASTVCYPIHMKRTNLVLDDVALEEAVRVLGVKTYSAAVNQALKEVVEVRKIRSLPQFFGQGLWQGNLSEMREDRRKRL